MGDSEGFWDDKILWYAGKILVYTLAGVALIMVLLFLVGFIFGVGELV